MTPLSKSRLLSYRQCPKRLWLEAHAPELLENSVGTEARFTAGHRLGEVARQLFGDTSYTIGKRSPAFEARFEAAGAQVFVDVLLPAQTPVKLPPRWGIVEVKSATSVKDVHLEDAAIQYFVATQAGLALDCIAIACVDSEWEYTHAGCYQGLLKQTDVTQEIQALVMAVPQWISAAQTVLRRRKPPVVATGAQCASPYPCGFLGHCQTGEPAVAHPVQWLPRVQTKALREHLSKPTVQCMKDVPDTLLNPLQQRVKRATLRGRAWRDAKGAALALTGHAAPFYFLDFETVADAVPRWLGTRPYQQIPFQFSLHRVGPRGGESHAEFLDLSGCDPRLALAQALVEVCGDEGTVFAYNARFEAMCLNELAERFVGKRKLAKALLSIADRLVDLEPIVRTHYYHPRQQGSWSLKAVLPTLLPHLSYTALNGVQNGVDAQLAYAEAVAPQTAPDRVRELRQQMLAYCKLDTQALVELWRAFK